MNTAFRSTLLALALALFSQIVGAAAPEQAPAEKAIRERLAVLEKLWAKGDSAGIAKEVYGRDAVIQGEGQPETIKTSAAVEAVIKHLVDDSQAVKLDLYNLRLLSPNAAHTWVTWHVTPKAPGEKPFDVKALFVWTRGAEGWRIRADMYSMGAM